MEKTDSSVFVTLVGPPNSGKTTLFNYLSGKNFRTANYPGATVEYAVSPILKKFNLKGSIIDSPGIISLTPGSPDEKVSVDALYDHPEFGIPDLLIVAVDASQLSRHLLLVKQLLTSGFNLIIALTMTDILSKKSFRINPEKLSSILGCKVVEIDGRTGKGVDDLLAEVVQNLKKTRLNRNRTRPEKLNGLLTKNLLNIYEEIGRIENEVIYSTGTDSKEVNLEEANQQLKILTNQSVKQDCYKIDETTLKIDKILLNRRWGLLVFFFIMSAIFTSIFWLAEPLMGLIDEFFAFLSASAFEVIGNNWLGDLAANGILSGAGSVLVFLPQILILFLLLGLLEDTGYLARGAMLVDKPLSKIGLNGKSFVPMLSGFACAIPAMMAARTIPNRRERLLTIFILPLMSCSARLPVYTLLIAFLLPAGKSWIAGFFLAAVYIFSIFSSIVVAGILNKIKNRIIREVDNSSFILELPAYRKPKFNFILNNSIINARTYLQKAGPAIFAFSVILWVLTYFPNSRPEINKTGLSETEIIQAEQAERLSNSYAAELGKIIQPVMSPLGMDWRVGVSLIAAFAAREVFVSSLALIFKVTDDEETLQQSMLESMRKAEIGNTGEKLFTPATITGLIIFFIFALQCLSTIVVSRKETGSWRIPLLQLVIFTGTAYIITYIAVNGLRAIGVN